MMKKNPQTPLFLSLIFMILKICMKTIKTSSSFELFSNSALVSFQLNHFHSTHDYQFISSVSSFRPLYT